MSKFFCVIIQFLFLIGNTKQSPHKWGILTFKAISKTIKSPSIKTLSNTIKKSVNMFCQKKNTIKNFACGIQKQGEKLLRTRHNLGSRSVKYLREEGIKNFKYIAPLTAKKVKQNIQMRSNMQTKGKWLKPLVKRSSEQMRGNELGSLINMISKSKSQVPFIFTGGLMGVTKLSLVDMSGDAMLNFKVEDDSEVEYPEDIEESVIDKEEKTEKIWKEYLKKKELPLSNEYRGEFLKASEKAMKDDEQDIEEIMKDPKKFLAKNQDKLKATRAKILASQQCKDITDEELKEKNKISKERDRKTQARIKKYHKKNKEFQKDYLDNVKKEENNYLKETKLRSKEFKQRNKELSKEFREKKEQLAKEFHEKNEAYAKTFDEEAKERVEAYKEFMELRESQGSIVDRETVLKDLNVFLSDNISPKFSAIERLIACELEKP